MNISLRQVTNLSPMYQKPVSYEEELFLSGQKANAAGVSRVSLSLGKTSDQKAHSGGKSQDLRLLLREMKKTEQQENQKKVFSAEGQTGIPGLTDGVEEKEEEKLQPTTKYNYKDVSNKIQRAKTSVSAGQAVLAASRKVNEVRRQMARKGADTEELQIALTHARRVELIARRKMRHLELEELVEHTQAADERMEEARDRAGSMGLSPIDAAKEEITQAQDKIFEQREELQQSAGEALSEKQQEEMARMQEQTEIREQEQQAMQEDLMESVEAMSKELSELISQFGEEEMQQLEESMQMLDLLEVIDPHMSEEELAKLRAKHRSAEERDLVKADMDYLKSMIRHMVGNDSAAAPTGPSGASGSISVSAAPAAVHFSAAPPVLSMPGGGGPAPMEGASVDVSV